MLLPNKILLSVQRQNLQLMHSMHACVRYFLLSFIMDAFYNCDVSHMVHLFMNVNFVFVFLQANQLHQLGYDVFIVTHRYSKVHTYQRITTPGAAKEFSHKYENVFQLWKSYMNMKPNTTLTNSSTLSTSPTSQPAADSNSAPTQENVPINTNSSTLSTSPTSQLAADSNSAPTQENVPINTNSSTSSLLAYQSACCCSL